MLHRGPVGLVFSIRNHGSLSSATERPARPSVPHRLGRYLEDFGAWTARNRRRSPICCQALHPIAASLCPTGLWRHAIGRCPPRPRFHAHAAQLQQKRSATDLPKASGDPGLDDLPVHGHRTASDRPQLTAVQARRISFSLLCTRSVRNCHLAVGRAEWATSDALRLSRYSRRGCSRPLTMLHPEAFMA